MANLIFYTGLKELLEAATAVDAGDWECILERSTSTWTPAATQTSLLDQAGWVEITVGSYSRQNIASPAVAVDAGNGRVEIDCTDVAFGSLETGQTVKSIVVARNDAGNYVPLLRIDTDDSGLLPRALGGGAFTVQINAEGLLNFTPS